MIRKLREIIFIYMKTYKEKDTEYVLFQTSTFDSAPPNKHSFLECQPLCFELR